MSVFGYVISLLHVWFYFELIQSISSLVYPHLAFRLAITVLLTNIMLLLFFIRRHDIFYFTLCFSFITQQTKQKKLVNVFFSSSKFSRCFVVLFSEKSKQNVHTVLNKKHCVFDCFIVS